MRSSVEFIPLCSELVLDAKDGAPPATVRISPWGKVKSAKGDFVVNEESVRAIQTAIAARGVDLHIDYEHQSLAGNHTRPDGLAPAAGWIKRVHAVPGQGLFADVEWTLPGAGYVMTKQYRYLSPVVNIRQADRVVVDIDSVGLTNRPAIAGMTPIVNKNGSALSSEGPFADPKVAALLDELATFVYIPDKRRATASPEEIIDLAVTNVQWSKSSEPDPRKAQASLAGLAGQLGIRSSDAAEILQAAIDYLKRRRSVAPERTATVENCTRGWSMLPDNLRKEVTLHDYVRETLRQEALPKTSTIALSNGQYELAAMSSVPLFPHSDGAGAEWDGSPMLQKLTSRDAYVKSQARSAVAMSSTPPFAYSSDPGAEWDGSPMLQKLTSRDAYVANETRSARLKADQQGQASRRRMAHSSAMSSDKPDRYTVIAKARQEWESSGLLRKLNDCSVYVNGDLRESGLRPLTETETLELPVGR